MTFIHPFDDPLVIAGQGTIGAEILRHSQDRLSAVFVPVGGGGLIAGIAGYLKMLRPDVKVIGVEPFESDAMYQSLAAGRRVHLDHVGIFADGVAVREVGELTFPIVRETVDEIVRGRTTRSAPPSRTSSTTRARSWSRPARSRRPGSRRGSSAKACATSRSSRC